VRGQVCVALVVSTLFVFAACSDDDGGSESSADTRRSPAAASVPDGSACELFTEGEAADVLGGAVRREMDLGGTEASTCTYVGEDDATRALGLGAGTFESDEAADNAFRRARADAQFDGLEIEDVPDLGADAYWLPESNNFERTISDQELTYGELDVRVGNRVLTAFVTPSNRDAARAIAELTLG